MNNKNKKIIILHDYFLYKGGGERLIITLAKKLKADIITAFIVKDAFDPRDYGIKTKELVKKSHFSNIPGVRHITVQLSFFLKTKFLKNYDTVIYSGDVVNAVYSSRGKNIAYVHTPPRHLYDNYELRISQYKFLKRQIFKVYALVSRFRFEKGIKKMDEIIVNSKTIQRRVKKYLNLESKVVYPPCDVGKFKWINQGDYYFSWARLYDVKRVDKIVEVFVKMPDKKLIVASSGPELKKIKKIAKGHNNIKILDWITDEELLELLGKCIATIYIPINEDFGMSPVESMSAGKPVIGVDEGGLQETIVQNKTGILIRSDFNINDIVDAVKKLNKERALIMRGDCENRAKEFSEEGFIQGMKEIIYK
jgi:glycosyltransferase involved in cell wall biosynthesis